MGTEGGVGRCRGFDSELLHVTWALSPDLAVIL